MALSNTANTTEKFKWHDATVPEKILIVTITPFVVLKVCTESSLKWIASAVEVTAKAIFLTFPNFVIGKITFAAKWVYKEILSPIGKAIKEVANAIINGIKTTANTIDF